MAFVFILSFTEGEKSSPTTNPLNYHHSHCLREENALYNEVPSVLGNDMVHSSGYDVVDPPDFWLPVM
eukprot:scaffold9370_cov37-Attheya_sp.AAC.1